MSCVTVCSARRWRSWSASVFGIWLAEPVLHAAPAAVLRPARGSVDADGKCAVRPARPADLFLLNLKIGALGRADHRRADLALPALGVHRARPAPARAALRLRLHVLAAPLFAAGAVLAYFVTAKGLEFLLNVSGERHRDHAGGHPVHLASSPT